MLDVLQKEVLIVFAQANKNLFDDRLVLPVFGKVFQIMDVVLLVDNQEDDEGLVLYVHTYEHQSLFEIRWKSFLLDQ